jgi:hypothetical protein
MSAENDTSVAKATDYVALAPPTFRTDGHPSRPMRVQKPLHRFNNRRSRRRNSDANCQRVDCIHISLLWSGVTLVTWKGPCKCPLQIPGSACSLTLLHYQRTQGGGGRRGAEGGHTIWLGTSTVGWWICNYTGYRNKKHARRELYDGLWWLETVSQNCGHQQAYCLSPSDMWARRTMVMMMPAGDNSWLDHQSSLAVLPAETSGESRRNERRNENLVYRYMKYLKGPSTCCTILRHGTSGFTYYPKEGVLRILSPLKIHRLSRVLTRDPWVQWQAH